METKAEIKAFLRRCAAFLQGGDTTYFTRRNDLDAICLLYRHADQFTETK